MKLTSDNVQLRVSLWDALSLTLFGVLYAVLVTVAGVVIAMVGAGRSWLWWASYAAVSLILLALSLSVLRRRVIGWMKRMLGRFPSDSDWVRSGEPGGDRLEDERAGC